MAVGGSGMIAWQAYCQWRGWPSEEAMVEAQGPGRHGNPTVRLRILSGKYRNTVTELAITYGCDQPSRGTIMSIKINPKNSSICHYPAKLSHVIVTTGIFAASWAGSYLMWPW